MADHAIDAVQASVVSGSALVFRIYRNDSDRDHKQKRPKPKVFLRRENEVGLSVYLAIEAAFRELSDPRGYCCLSTRDIRDSPDPLDEVQDRENHANIMGVPLKSDDEETALRIAKYLARIAEDREFEPETPQRIAIRGN